MGARIQQRGARHPLVETGAQLYETPAVATQALLRHEALPPRLWEPAAGKGAISRILKKRGHTVVAEDLMAYDGADGDITPGKDFFQAERAPSRCGAIVSNPPFAWADDFVRHGLALVPKVVVLLRLAALEGVGRSDLIDRHLVRLWVGKERLPMLHREGWTGPRLNGSAVPYAWFVFERQGRLDGWEGRRISWRK